MDSRFAKDTFLRKIVSPNSFIHRLNFLGGRAIVIFLVFIFHPRKVKHSDKQPSSASFPSDKQSSLKIGSAGSSGRHKVCIANKSEWTALFLFECKSGMMTIPSSIKISAFPQSLGSITISNGLAEANDVEESSNTGSVINVEWGEHITLGSHEGLWRMSFAKSIHNSEKMQNSFGHGDPPKVRRTLGSANSLHIIAHFSAILPCKFTRR